MKATALQRRVLTWYFKHKRNLPWRTIRDPYAIWVSEIMLQQTQVDTVIPYFHRFLDRFPTIHSLALATIPEVLKIWEGLGYYARARNLHKAAMVIVNDLQGNFPADYKELRKLPGIGDYTAAAIASIAFQQPVPSIDGNIRRVLARWIALRDDPTGGEGAAEIKQTAQKHIYRTDPGSWNQALMELGALLCLPRDPVCDRCPVADNCEARRLNLTDLIPVKKTRQPIPHYDVTAGLIWDGDLLLITRRKEKGLLGGLWEFPGGKQEPGETLEECLVRELEEELAITVKVGDKFCSVDHAYSHFKITLHVFSCVYLEGPPQALDCAEWKWIYPRDLPRYAFPRADRHVIERLVDIGTTGRN